jgi:hypothetical protein
MIQFLLEENIDDILEYFEISNIENSYCHLEVGAKRKLRFDIVISRKENKDEALKDPLIVIENKFKAIPTVKQLELYDHFLNNHRNCKKVLIVFCEEQLTESVKNHCQEHQWKIKTYFSFSKSSDCLLNQLNKINPIFKENSESKELILNHYKEHLQNYHDRVFEIINSKFLTKEYNREYYSIYMLILLGKISKEIQKVIEEKQKNTQFYPKISESIDVGSRIIPAVALWFSFNKENREYSGIESQSMGINGTRISIGIYYKRSRKYLDSNQKFVRKLSETINKIESDVKFKTDEKEDAGSSMKTIFSDDLTKWKNNEIPEKAAMLFIEYCKASKKIMLSES